MTPVYIGLLQFNHIIFSTLNTSPSLKVRGVCLDLSNTFRRVWNIGIF